MPPCVRAAAMLAVAFSLAMPLAHAQAADLPPTERVALLKWLQAGSYKKWPRESAPHRSMGPHKALVITYLNPTLDRSLEAKAADPPEGLGGGQGTARRSRQACGLGRVGEEFGGERKRQGLVLVRAIGHHLKWQRGVPGARRAAVFGLSYARA